jgi:hypothetical protein
MRRTVTKTARNPARSLAAVVVLLALLWGASASARQARASTAAANRQSAAICQRDVQPLTHQEAAVDFTKVTAGQMARLLREAASTADRIDAGLAKVAAPAAYRRKLDALITDNSRTAAANRKLAAVFGAIAPGKRVNREAPAYRRASELVNAAQDAASLLAGEDDLPELCAVTA